jgi:trimeric autotransporter adhesin
MVRRILIAATCGLIWGSVACGGGSRSIQTGNVPALASIQVSGVNNNVIVGQNEQLKAVAAYSNNTNQDVTSSAAWSSSDNTVATVASDGMVTAKGNGNCIISAQIGTVTGSLGLAIGPALVSLAIAPTQPQIPVSTTTQFIATGTYSDQSTRNLTTEVTWASSNSSIATVSMAPPTMGLATALVQGSTTISATLGSVSASISLTVTAVTPVSIALTPSNPTLALGLSQQFMAEATFSDNSSLDVTNVVQWQSSAPNITSITTSGLAVARSLGSATIRASFDGVTGTTLETVNAANVRSIAINSSSRSAAQGTQQAFTAIGTYNDGSTHDLTGVVTWSSSDTTILKFGSIKGWATSIAPGLVNITATLGALTATVPFTVTNATIVSVVVGPVAASMATGARTVYNATGIFSDSSTQNVSGIAAWSTDNSSVATLGTLFENYGAAAVGVSAGTANISATFSYAGARATGSSQLTVSTASLQSLSVSPESTLLAPGTGTWIMANATFTDGSTEPLSPLCTWSSSSPSVATVSAGGFVGGQSPGATTITAQDASVSATANVLVESGSLTSIQVAPNSATVPMGFGRQFTAIGNFSDGQTLNLTAFANWTSSDPSVATISNATTTNVYSVGQATGLQPGTTTISAVFDSQVGTAAVTVTNATPTSITVSPSSASIAVGSAQMFTARGAFSDGSIMEITSQVAWTSSTPAVATVGAQGGTRALASGTTTISASTDGVTGSAVLTVQ